VKPIVTQPPAGNPNPADLWKWMQAYEKKTGGSMLEIPTPRWTAYDAKCYGTKPMPGTTMIVTARAYASPIWYTPEK
jgi:hypothetical protein